jgi:phenylacetate-CoA ligase
MGVRLGDRRLDIWGATEFAPPKRALHRISRRIWRHDRLSAFETTDAEVDAQLRYAVRFRPTLLRGYASAVYRFAQRAAALGIRLPTLRAISTSADALLPSMRRTIEEAFGVPAFDQYGCGEVLAIAFECEAHHALHVAEEHVVVEIDAPAGHEGDVLVTDLDNYAMPLLRYRNGDCGIVETTPCPCGRPGMLLRSPVGRAGECIVLPDSRRYNRTFFNRFFADYPSVRAYQIRQPGPASIEVVVEHVGQEEDLRGMQQRLRDRIPGLLDLRFRTATIRPGPSGKFQVIMPA